MDNLLNRYRTLIFAYETFIRNVERAIKNSETAAKKIDRLCLDAHDRKFYSVAHRAKIELTELKVSKQVDFKIIIKDIQADTIQLRSKIDRLKSENKILADHHDFIKTVHWFNGFCEFIKDIRPGYVTESTWIRSENKTPPQATTNGLGTIFSDGQNLEKLVKLLIERKFVSEEAGRLTWTGIEHETAKGRGYQLIALSEVCRPLYVKNEYQAKELHSAWTSYFNFDIAVNNWQPSLKHKISDSYFNLFSFVRHSLKF